MSVGLDTSVVLRLLTGAPPAQAEAARRLLEGASAPPAVSDLVVGEAYHALRHHYEVPHLEAVRALGALLADRRVRAPGTAARVLRDAAAAARGGPGVMDRLIAADYADDGLALVTFDRDLARLPGVERLGTGGGRGG